MSNWTCRAAEYRGLGIGHSVYFMYVYTPWITTETWPVYWAVHDEIDEGRA